MNSTSPKLKPDYSCWSTVIGDGCSDLPPRKLFLTVKDPSSLTVGKQIIFKPKDHPDDKREFLVLVESIEPNGDEFLVTCKELDSDAR